MTKKSTSKKARKKTTKKTTKKKVAAKKTAIKKAATKSTPKKTKAAKKKTTSTARGKSNSKKKTTLSRREQMIQKIKQDLLAQRESLLKEAEHTLNSLPGDINFPDMGDQATAETDRNFMLRLRDRERMLIKKIEETIDRIDSEDYGICDECGAAIGIKRLEARPVTTYCIDCKTRQEEEERIAEGG
jgi:DnaK suppressor protein